MPMDVYGHVDLDTQLAALDRLDDDLSGWRRVAANYRCQAGWHDGEHLPDLLLRRQDSNLDHWNQNPRCCHYTTADWPPS
jgi:hypothetical protein